MKKLLLSVMLIGFSVIVYGIFEQNKQNEANSAQKHQTDEMSKFNLFINDFNETKSKHDLHSRFIPVKYKKTIESQLKLKLAILDFEEAEDIIERARKLQQSLSLPVEGKKLVIAGYDTQGKPIYEENKAKVHPTALSVFNKSIPLYQNVKKQMDSLTERKDDNDYNFIMYYTKGELYYRYTQLFSTPETSRELFNQTVDFYKKALRFRPADIQTVINIELLIKNEKSMNAPGTPDQQRSKLLNQLPGISGSKGN